MSTRRILAFSGSLRAVSSNTELLKAAALVAPESIRVSLYEGLSALPPFNPDLDGESAVPPAPVADLRARVAQADALLLSSPEYAHGVPGALKNALDWLVSSPAIVDKPVGLLNASPRSRHAQESLAETLRTMAATVVPEASLEFALTGRRSAAAEIAADGVLRDRLRSALYALSEAVESDGGHIPISDRPGCEFV